MEEPLTRTGVEVAYLDIVACAEQPVQVGSDAFGREELVDPVVHEVEENFAAVEGQQPANQLNGHALEAEGVDERKRRCQLGALLLEIVYQPAGGLLKGGLLGDDRNVAWQLPSGSGEAA